MSAGFTIAQSAEDVASGLDGLVPGSTDAIQLNPLPGIADNPGANLLTLGTDLGIPPDMGMLGNGGASDMALDFFGAQQLIDTLGLGPNSELASALFSAVGTDGAFIVPIVDSINSLSNLGGFSLGDALTLPGLNGQAVGFSIAGADTPGVALLNQNADGGIVGIAVMADDAAGNGSLIGISLASGDDSGNGELVGIAVASGEDSGNGQLLSLSSLESQQSEASACEGAACGEQTDDREATSEGETEELQTQQECTTTDQDGDGVCDSVDRCANTPEDTAVLQNGCHLETDRPLVLEGINFETGSSRITPASEPELKQAVSILREHPRLFISIDGHTDATGNPQINQPLSLERAQSVLNFFVAHGIAKNRLIARGFGSAKPLLTLGDEKAIPENRRVEINVVDKATFATIAAEAERRRAAELEAVRQAQQAAQQREEMRRRAKEQEQRAAKADEDYQEVLEFLEETGTAERANENQQQDEPAPADGDYELEVIGSDTPDN